MSLNRLVKFGSAHENVCMFEFFYCCNRAQFFSQYFRWNLLVQGFWKKIEVAIAFYCIFRLYEGHHMQKRLVRKTPVSRQSAT